VLGLAVFLAATTAMFDAGYADHPELLEPDTRLVVENPGMRVLGLVTGPSVGGYALHRDALTLAVLAAMMSVLAVVRHTRQAEELGRSELVAAGVTGRHAPLAAAVVVALAADVALALGLGLALLVAGQPAAGSFVGGASIALVGMVFVGVAAVTSQLASTTRGATGMAAAVLGASFALAAVGNMAGTVDSTALRVTSAWPAWLSPIGWGQQMRPFADDLWWPLALAAGATAVLVATAGALVARRDVGRGMWAERPGPGHATHALVRPAGLVWRLQRGALLGWAGGLLGFGLVFGALSERIGGLEGAAAQWYETFGGAADLVGAYWASMLQIAGTAVAVYVVTLLLRLGRDEAGGVLEPVLGTSATRLRWLGAYALNAVVGATLLMLLFATAMVLTGGQVLGGTGALVGELVGAALVQLPAVAVLGSAVLVAVTVVPRWATGVSWGLVVLCVFVGPMFGPALGLPSWLVDVSPFSHVPNAPAVAVSRQPLLALGLVAVLLASVAVVVLRRRNLVLPA
jgi:ABC-2 type transport system permease protein